MKDITRYILFLLDETGSMQVCKNSTIDGFNGYIQSLKDGTPTKFTLCTFNSERIKKVYTEMDISDVFPLNTDTYNPNFNTNLYDAIGATIKQVEVPLSNMIKFLKEPPARLFIILTDGKENASQTYTKSSIKEIIQGKEKEGWTFVYLGANQDVWEEAVPIGLTVTNTADFFVSDLGIKNMFKTLETSTTFYTTTYKTAVIPITQAATNFFKTEDTKNSPSTPIYTIKKKRTKKITQSK
mgnify:CR=1 FL=1